MNSSTNLPVPSQIHPSPLDAIDWGTAVASNTVDVYFAGQGETFAGHTSFGWTDYEIGQTLAAMAEFETVANITFNRVSAAAEADFRMVIAAPIFFSAAMYPPGHANAGVGIFNRASLNADGGFAQGGAGFRIMLHELAHGLGLAHPHDEGGESDILDGVTSSFGDYGDFDLNQGVFTTLSYNYGYRSETGLETSRAYGKAGTLSPLDIALIQERYGARQGADEDATTYALSAVNGTGTFYSAIWDTGGTDWISYGGSGKATIDLRAATLEYEVGGGGFVSKIEGTFGGYTIAHGVMIENAQGGRGADILTGNDGDNRILGGAGADRLYGQGGHDMLDGGAGGDFLDGGAGIDTASYASATASGVHVDLLVVSDGTGDAAGDSYHAIENVTGTDFGDTLLGDGNANLYIGGDGHDGLFTRGGNDTLIGGKGGDILSGGRGIDTASYETAGSGVVLDILQTHLGQGDARGDTFSSIENVTGSNFGDELLGDNTANLYIGGDGHDGLFTRGGDDTLIGGKGGDILSGGSGIDTASYETAGSGIVLDILQAHLGRGDAQGDTFSFIENVTGSNFDDNIVMDDGANVIAGGLGDDLLFGRGGADILNGGAGDDVLNGGSGADIADYTGAAFSDYTVRFLPDSGYTRVTHNSTGELDILIQMEILRFDDADVIL